MKKHYKRRLLELYWCAVVSVAVLGHGVVNAQQLTWLGTLPYHNKSSNANSVSADGTVVVGTAWNANDELRAFRWTKDQGMQDLGALGGGFSTASAVSANGKVVIGITATSNGDMRGYRWTVEEKMQDLGTTPNYTAWSSTQGISADGTVIIGDVGDTNGLRRAYRWTAVEGITELSTVSEKYSEARAISSDGSIIVGVSQQTSEDEQRAYRWTKDSGVQYLDTLPGNTAWSAATTISANGEYAAGTLILWSSNTTFDEYPCRWSTDGSVQKLQQLPNMSRWYLNGSSADGSVIIGTTIEGDQHKAFYWTANGGVIDLNDLYADLLTDGSSLMMAQGLSPDARFIVGTGWNSTTERMEAFLLDTRTIPTSVSEPDIDQPLQILLTSSQETSIVSFNLPRMEQVRISIFDALGIEAATVDAGVLSVGEHRLWLNVQELPAGLYHCRLQAGTMTAIEKFVVMK